MKKDEGGDLQKVTLNLYHGDYQTLSDMFPELTAGVVIRRLVRNFINTSRASHQSPQLSTPIEL